MQTTKGFRTRIKFCGITREEDALEAARLGVDLLGFIFYSKSKRYVTLDQVVSIKSALPAWISTVALFVNPEPKEVKSVIERMKPTYLQFHGDETEAFCKQFGHPYIKALRVDDAFDWSQACDQFKSAEALLFDTKVTGAYGGSGKSFDWSQYQVPEKAKQWTALAGGLDANNVMSAIEQCRPQMVDVSGGIEASPGVKDSQKMSEFMAAVLKASLD